MLRTGSEAGTGGCCSWGETWSKCLSHRNIKSPGQRLGRKSVQATGLNLEVQDGRRKDGGVQRSLGLSVA